MGNKDYYSILGLTEEDKKLTGEDFVKACKTKYRSLAKQYHPDKYANKSEAERKEAEEKFKEITEAYDVLTDPKKKQQYESRGSYDGGFNWEGFGNTGMDDIDEMLNRFRNGSFNPFSGGFGFGMGDMGGMGGFQQPHSNSPAKPQPLKIKLHISIEDIYNAKSKKIRYKRMTPCTYCDGRGTESGGRIEVCPVCGGVGQTVRTERRGPMTIQQMAPCDHCHGTGQIVANPCKHCNGAGRVVTTEELDIQIPAGAMDGATFVVSGKGNYAERSKTIVGDMIILLTVDPNEKFAIANQYDLYTVVDVPILDCITGSKIDVPLFNGKKTTIDIPKFTRDGSVIRVNGLGMPTGYGRGNLLVEVKQKFPRDLSRSEEKSIKELKESKNFK